MAMAGDTSLIQCSICFNNKVKRQPRVLPCQHSFCTECLTAWHNQRRHGDRSNTAVACPTCRTNVTLPPGGVAAFPIDINVGRIYEVMNKGQSEAQCHRCRDKGRLREVNVLCVDCNLSLCQECGPEHTQMTLFASHLLRKSFCKAHGIRYQWICNTCSIGLCTKCVYAGHHDDHDVNDLKIGIADMKKKLNDTTELLKSPLSRLDKEIAARRHEWGAQENILQMVCLMRKEIERIVESVESHKAFHKSAEEFLKDGEKLRDDTAALIKRSECLMKQDDDTFLANLPIPERENMQTKTRIEDALELFPRHARMQSDMCHLANADIIVEILRNCKIVCVMSEMMTSDMSVYFTPEALLKIDCGNNCDIKKPKRICVTPDADVVVCEFDGGPVYKVFIDGTMTQLHPGGAAACVNGDDVYMISTNGDSLIQIKQDGYKVQHKLNPPIPSPNGVAVIGDMVLILGGTTLFKRSLVDTQRNQELAVTDDSTNSLHVTCKGEIKLFTSNFWAHRVTVHEEHGNVLYQFGGKGNTDGLFNRPRGLTTMGDKLLLVADWCNHRIVQFEFDGTFVKNLLTKEDGISYPVDVAFKYPYLWVAEYEGSAGSSLKLFKCTYYESIC